jgi:nicotinate-nucleotide adenylyltransferase
LNIALFGGTFDPIHAGHLRAAQAAARKFRLDQILFVPSGNPPHKLTGDLTPFHHRYSMVALACAGEPRFVPSLLEAPHPDGRHHFSINTALIVSRMLGTKDHLYFLIGIDAFLDIPYWKEYRRLLDLVDFIVVSRPGFSNDEFTKVLPAGLLRGASGRPGPDKINLSKSTLHILPGVEVPAASSQIRAALRARRRVAGLVPPLVEEYILKEGLYRPIGTGKKR